MRFTGNIGKPRSEWRWTPETFIDFQQERGDVSDIATTRRILSWAQKSGLNDEGAPTAKYPLLYLTLDLGDRTYAPYYLYGREGRAHLHVWLNDMGEAFSKGRPAREELCSKLTGITGVEVSPARSYPAIPFAQLEDPIVLEKLLEEATRPLGVIRRER